MKMYFSAILLFIILGSVEERKNSWIIFQAFCPLKV